MKDWVVQKRLNKLCENGALNNENNLMLFKEYEQDMCNNIPKEESEARTILILGNKGLINFTLKEKFGYQYFNESLEEFAVGKIGLMKAVDSYKLNSGVKFSTYATRVIINEIYMYYRRINNKSNIGEKNKVSFEEVFRVDYNNDANVSLVNILSEDADFIEKVATDDLAERVIKNFIYLTHDEQISIIYTFGLFGKKQMKQEEISKIIGKARSCVSKNLIAGIKKLKVLMLDEKDLTEEERMFKYKMWKSIKESQKANRGEVNL